MLLRQQRHLGARFGPKRAVLHVAAYKQDQNTAHPSSKTSQQQEQLEPNRVLKASLDSILRTYYERTPTAAQVIQQVYEQGYGADQVAHDHFAFRTFGVPGLGIEPLGAALEDFGYCLRDYHTFLRTNVLAAWYAPPKELYDVLPRIFVSQLQVDKLSKEAQKTIHSYTDGITSGQGSVHAAEDIAAGTASSRGGVKAGPSGRGSGSPLAAWTAAVTNTLPWRTPTRDDYQALLQETEYGAWVLVNGYALNHTALSVHRIAGGPGDIYAFASDLASKGFKMNDEGGLVKVTPDGELLQCSTVADLVDFRFADDDQVQRVVGAYMEFAERKVLPKYQHLAAAGQAVREQHRRDGFDTGNATGIFASTTMAAQTAQQQGLL